MRGKHLATLATVSSAPVYYEVVEGRRSSDHIEGWRSVKYGESFEAPVLRIGVHTAEAIMATTVLPRLPGRGEAVLDRGERAYSSSLRLGIDRDNSSLTVLLRVTDDVLGVHVHHEGVAP